MSVSWAADDMKPGFQRARTHSKPGFMTSRLARGAQLAARGVQIAVLGGASVT